jgi:hypothetical protein
MLGIKITEYSKYIYIYMSGVGRTRKRSSFPVRSSDFSLLHSVPFGSGNHLISYPISTPISFPRSILPEAKSWPLTSMHFWLYCECVQVHFSSRRSDSALLTAIFINQNMANFLKYVKSSFVSPRSRREINIKRCNKAMSYEGLVWADLYQYWDRWRGVMEKS